MPDAEPAARPRDAATLILLDGEGEATRVLMGRRSARHVFMPSVYVFPGGRVDRDDSRGPATGTLDARDERRLIDGLGSRGTPTRARALAVAALRETWEETGRAIGAVAGGRLVPSLSGLRYVARAITPPGRTRRFDTRFFAARLGALPALTEGHGATDELEDLTWVPLHREEDRPLARITAIILDELRERLAADPLLERDVPVPFYRPRHGRVTRETQ